MSTKADALCFVGVCHDVSLFISIQKLRHSYTFIYVYMCAVVNITGRSSVDQVTVHYRRGLQNKFYSLTGYLRN